MNFDESSEPASHLSSIQNFDPDAFTDRGIDASVGRHGAPDRIEAHKWFNIAAMSGAGEAIRLRRELALEMTADEIAKAQRLAREWLAHNKTAAA